MSLIELAVVVVIIGLILGIGTASWTMLIDARQLSRTRGEMRRASNCIMQRVEASARYPDYEEDFTTASTALVNTCLAQRQDAWNGFIYFIEGVEEGAATSLQTSFSGSPGCIAPNVTAADADPCAPSNVIKPDQTSSVATDKDGNTVERVAYILVSYGEDRSADSATYGDLFDADTHAATMDIGSPPDFTGTEVAGVATRDDVYLIVTYEDMLAAIAEGRL